MTALIGSNCQFLCCVLNAKVRCRQPIWSGAAWEMKVWPFGAALQGEASNRLMLRWLKTVVVNDEGKGVERGVRWGSGRRA